MSDEKGILPFDDISNLKTWVSLNQDTKLVTFFIWICKLNHHVAHALLVHKLDDYLLVRHRWFTFEVKWAGLRSLQE